MVSFIGDMWKAAINIKRNYENSEDVSDVVILQRHVAGKYSYLMLRCFDEIDGNIVSLDSGTLMGMCARCEYYEYTFNVNCTYFFMEDVFTGKLYTGLIVN